MTLPKLCRGMRRFSAPAALMFWSGRERFFCPFLLGLASTAAAFDFKSIRSPPSPARPKNAQVRPQQAGLSRASRFPANYGGTALRASAFSVRRALFALALTAALPGCGGTSGTAQLAAAAPKVQITDIKVGTGISPKPGQICTVNYTGWLYENGVKGAKFDSSYDRKQPFSFVLGEHKVIEGWERGVSTLRVGGKRMLIIPPELAYGSQGQGGKIPPNATLLFEIELLDVKAPVQ